MDQLVDYCNKLYDKNAQLRLWLFVVVVGLGSAFVAIAVILNELAKAREEDWEIVCWVFGVSGGIAVVASFVVFVIAQLASEVAMKIARLDMAEVKQDFIEHR